MIRKFIYTACVALLALSALAQVAPGDPSAMDNAIIGQADLIVVGTVTDVTVGDTGDNTSTAGPMSGGKDVTANTASIKVDQVLKGEKVDNINVNYTSSGGNNKLEAEKQKIFFLKRAQGGHAFVNSFEVREIDQLETIEEKIKDFPLKVQSEGKIGPLFIEKEAIVNLKLLNTGATPIEISQFSIFLENYAYSPLVKGPIPISIQMIIPEGIRPTGPGKPVTLTVPAGGELAVKLKVTCNKPSSLLFLTEGTCLQMPIALRLNARGSFPKGPDGKAVVGKLYAATSPWTTVMIGYPLPEEAGVDEVE